MKSRELIPNAVGYPNRIHEAIGEHSLYALGNLELLDRPCVGICGSRDASDDALRWSYHFGCEAANQGIVVVSGYARGVDREAHKGALDAGGTTIAVLPEGIEHFKVRRDLQRAINLDENFLALSMFQPNAQWSVWRAMERNKLIVGLSLGLFVIEARERGGTINAAFECIRQRKRLWAVAYDRSSASNSGNAKLLARLAIPIRHLDELGPALEAAMSDPPPEARQLVLSVMSPDTSVREEG